MIEIKQRVDTKLLIAFNARNEHDRSKFCEDLKESVSEMDEMENLRIEGELEKSKPSLRASRPTSTAENRDSGRFFYQCNENKVVNLTGEPYLSSICTPNLG